MFFCSWSDMFNSFRASDVSMFVTQAVGSADRLTPLHLPRHQGLLEEYVVVRIVLMLRGAFIGPRMHEQPALAQQRDPLLGDILARNRHCGRRAEKHFLFGDQNRRLRRRGFQYGFDASAPLCGVGCCYARPVEASRHSGGRRDVPLDTWKTFGHEGISLSRMGTAGPAVTALAQQSSSRCVRAEFCRG